MSSTLNDVIRHDLIVCLLVAFLPDYPYVSSLQNFRFFHIVLRMAPYRIAPDEDPDDEDDDDDPDDDDDDDDDDDELDDDDPDDEDEEPDDDDDELDEHVAGGDLLRQDLILSGFNGDAAG